MDWGFISSRLLTALLVSFGGGLLTMITLAWKIYKSVNRLEQRSYRAKNENVIQFKALKAVIKAIKSGEKNGTLTQAEKDIDEYLHSSIH